MTMLQPKTFAEARSLSSSIGHDAACRQMRKNCRKAWNDDDLALAVTTERRVLRSLGYGELVDAIEADEAAFERGLEKAAA